MSLPVVTFFNNKGGVGKTSLVYHVSWMMAELGLSVLAADLDPQANLTAAFLDEDEIESLWSEDNRPSTVYHSVQPLIRGVGDILSASPVVDIDDRIALLPGDLALARFEDDLSQQWPECLSRKERAFRVISAFWRLLQSGGREQGVDLVLVDLGPNLGAINRAALVATDYLVVPLAPDLFSLQGLKNLGPTVHEWRQDWAERLDKNPVPDLELPRGDMRPVGYVVLQHAVRLDRPARAYERWVERIPFVYAEHVLREEVSGTRTFGDDENCLALLKHYHSLMPLAQEARKPIFRLTAADGAIGAHQHAAQQAYAHFRELTVVVAQRCGISLPVSTP